MINEMKKRCSEMRSDILKMLSCAGSGHTGGSLSCVEIIVALYFGVMQFGKDHSDKKDRFILSKGHGCPTLYSAFVQKGYIPKEELMTLRKYGSRLQGHPHMKRLAVLDSSSGSLGQGLSIANGLALGMRLDKLDHKVYCLMGDGELEEGQVWEAAMTSSHYKLKNLCVIIDRNSLQIDGSTEDIKSIEPIDLKFKAFGWEVLEVNGHDLEALIGALKKTGTFEKPLCIIAKTVKGKGVSFIENMLGWHGVAPKIAELEAALKELIHKK